MENIINNPGLQHLTEKILWNLNYENMEACQFINKSFKQILVDPLFWLRKFIQEGRLSTKNKNDWTKVISQMKNTYMEEKIVIYLKWTLKTIGAVNLPCYTNPIVQNDFRNQIFQSARDNNLAIVKILAPLTDNPNAPNIFGLTPIYRAAIYGHAEIVKILAPLTDNPNAPEIAGQTPIYISACFGYAEIIKILAPLTDNPNVPNKYGVSPLHLAASNGNTEIVKILAPLTDNPDAPNREGETPIFLAARHGHREIVKILISFMAPTTRSTKMAKKF